MRLHDNHLRHTITLVLAISLFACPLGWAAYITVGSAQAFEQFGTIPPETREIDAVFTATPPLPPPIPTLGPGQFFSEDNRPEIGVKHGSDNFGWGKVRGNPGLVVVWVTDENGTHYMTMDATGDAFLGTLDEATNSRAADGFQEYVRQAEEIQKQRISTAAVGIGSGAAVGIFAWGIGLCPVTGGAGCVAGLIGGIAVAVGTAVTNIINMADLNSQLGDIQDNLVESFSEAANLAQP